jgi:hypothetical protein
VVTNWSGIHGVQGEVKLTTVKTTANGLTNGDLLFGNGPDVGWLSADGTVSNFNWGILAKSMQADRARTYVDVLAAFC